MFFVSVRRSPVALSKISNNSHINFSNRDIPAAIEALGARKIDQIEQALHFLIRDRIAALDAHLEHRVRARRAFVHLRCADAAVLRGALQQLVSTVIVSSEQKKKLL